MICICKQLKCKYVKVSKIPYANPTHQPPIATHYKCKLRRDMMCGWEQKDYIKNYVYQTGDVWYDDEFLLFMETECPNRNKFKIMRKLATV